MRILIDCSFIDFEQIPSGIPRVVRSYLEQGFIWSQATGIEVIPVFSGSSGLYVSAGLPADLLPEYMERYLKLGQTPQPSKFRRGATIFFRAVAEYFPNIFHHTLFLIYSVFKFPFLHPIFSRIEGRVRSWFWKPVHMLERSNAKPEAITLVESDVVFAPSYWHDIDPRFWQQIADKCTLVCLIHDILPISHPGYYERPWNFKFLYATRKILDSATVVATVSNTTKSEIEKFFPDRSKNVRFLTALNGVNSNLATNISSCRRQDFANVFQKEMPPYLLVGSIEPKKCQKEVVEAFVDLRECGLMKRQLVIIGRRGWLSEEIEETIQLAADRGHVRWFSDASDDDLAFAYYSCYALVFSSLAEGFGLPLIEAANAGRPIIAKKIAITEEIMGNTCLYYEKDSQLQQAILQMEEVDTYSAFVDRSEAFSWPDWQLLASELFDRLSELSRIRAR